MARIAGVTLPPNKRIEYALTAIHGVGRALSRDILKGTKIDPNTRAKDLSSEDERKIRDYLEKKKYTIEGELRLEKMRNIQRMKRIKCYRGVRHERNLPVRGQRTKTNSRTVRGNVRITMGSGKRKEEKT